MQPAITYNYDALGDITSKSDTGSYTYGSGAGPHAVTSISGPAGGSYGYDADGNMINRNGTAITWNSDNLPVSITQSGSNSSSFAYAPDKHRYYQSAVINGVTETTVYVGAFDAVITGGVTTYRYHLSADSREVAEVDLSNSGSSVIEKVSYVLSDHLGSTDVVETTDVNGNVLSTTYMSFSAWGNRREPGTWLPPVGSSETQADHNADRYGFTHHEMLDNVNLIHMNGRIYDPNLGRFLSVDPVFEFPTNTQSLNPYSYVLNNPLSMTDPTGYVADSCGTGQTSCPDNSPQSQSTTVHVSYTPTGSHIAISGTVTATALGNGNYAVTGSNKAVAQAFSTGAHAMFGNGTEPSSQGPGTGSSLGKSVGDGVTSPGTGSIPASTDAATGSQAQPNNATSSARNPSQSNDNQFDNPTGHGERGRDAAGNGDYGALRTGADGRHYKHQGEDYLASPGQVVKADMSGRVTREIKIYGSSDVKADPRLAQFRGVEIANPDTGFSSKLFYVLPKPGIIGTNVHAGDPIGTAQDRAGLMQGMRNHVHVEIRQNGTLVDPRDYIHPPN